MNTEEKAREVIKLASEHFQTNHNDGESCDGCVHSWGNELLEAVSALFRDEGKLKEELDVTDDLLERKRAKLTVIEGIRSNQEVALASHRGQANELKRDLDVLQQDFDKLNAVKNELYHEKVKLESTLEAKAGQIREYDAERENLIASLEVKAGYLKNNADLIAQLSGNGRLLNRSYTSVDELHDADMAGILCNLENDKKILAIKALRNAEVCFTTPISETQAVRLQGHISLKYSKRIVDGIQEMIKTVRAENNESLQAELDKNEATINVLGSERNSKSAECHSLSVALENKAAYASMLEKQRDIVNESNEKLNNQILELIKQRDTALSNSKGFMGDVKSRQIELQERREQVSVQQQEVDEQNVKITKLEAMLTTWKNTNAKNNQTIEHLNNQIKDRDDTLESCREDMKSRIEEIADLTKVTSNQASWILEFTGGTNPIKEQDDGESSES